MCLYGAERMMRGSFHLTGLFGAELVAFCLSEDCPEAFLSHRKSSVAIDEWILRRRRHPVSG